VRKIISAAGMREIDRLTTERYAMPSSLLMEAAAATAARAIEVQLADSLAHRKVLILCGRGNNGGDGAALARCLWIIGAHPCTVLFGRVEDAQGDARINFEIARRIDGSASGSRASTFSFIECASVTAWEEIVSPKEHYDVIVDALFGTGLTRPLEGIYCKVIDHLTQLRKARDEAQRDRPLFVSLDLPSGLNADQATPIGATVRSDLTVSFTAPKPANVLSPATHYGGQLVVADIGSPSALLDAAPSQLFLAESSDARLWLEQTRYQPGSYKNTHGHALMIAGSRRMTGAAVLCGEAAMRAGAGLVTVATAFSALPSVAARVMPEIMTAPLDETDDGAISAAAVHQADELTARATVIAIGPGLSSTDEGTRSFVRAIVERRTTPVVIDADGLNALSPWPESLRGSHEAPLILTPHEGEMLRLLGATDRSALADRVGVLREFATRHALIVVLKGTRTLIAAPDNRVIVNPTGNAGLGTAGAGDTLTGIITGFCAQAYATLKDRANAVAATVAAVFVGGMAGDIVARERGMRTMLASDIREGLSVAIRELDATGERPS